MSKARILIIDDEPNIRDTMRLALEVAGHTTETAPDGAAGLERYGTGAEWDLVLLDQRMPGMDGIEVLRRMRELRPDAEVIMVTAFATVDLAVEAMKVGALDFLRKPFTPETLRRTVAAGLERARISAVPPIQRPAFTPAASHARFRSLDGYQFWPAPDAVSAELPEAGEIRRTFMVASPQEQTEPCTLVFSGRVVEVVLREAGDSALPAGRVWDAAAWAVLMSLMWERRGMPAARIDVTDLTHEQLGILRGLLKTSTVAWGRASRS